MKKSNYLVFLFFSLVFIASANHSIAQLTVSVSNKKDACNGLNNGSIDISVSNNTGSITINVFGPPNFTFNDAGPLTSLSGLPPREGSQDYLVVVQDDNDNAFVNFTIENIITPLSVSLAPGSPSDNTSCTTPDGFIDIDVSGGSGEGYTYQWTSSNGFTSTSEDISGLAGGTYMVEVFDDSTNCSEILNTLIIDPSPMLFNIATASPLQVCDGDDAVIALDGSENPPGSEIVEYTIKVNGVLDNSTTVVGNGSPVSLTLPFGSFSSGDVLTVEADNANCTAIDMVGSVTINVNPRPVAEFEYSATPYCINAADPGPTFLNGGEAGTFTAPAGLVINASTGQVDINASTPGTYTVTNTIAATGGCPPIVFDAEITITDLPVAEFEYSASPYCSSDTDPLPTFLNSGVAGTFTASPVGLVIDGGSGLVDLSASTGGTYTVTNTINASGGCPQVTFDATIEIQQAEVPDFEYSGTPFCSSGTDTSPTYLDGGVAGLFTAPAGLIIDGSSGLVDLSASTPGTYTVTNTIAATGSCPEISFTSDITITELPIADFEYSGSPYCSSDADPAPTFLNGGVAGTFSAPAGLVIDGTTGQVNLAASTAGTYTVTNTINASTGCPQVTFDAVIEIQPAPIADFEYSTTPYCSSEPDTSPTFLNGGFAGNFTAPAGLVIDASTGTVDLSASTAGTYTVTNTIAASGSCPQIFYTSDITITELPIADFEYSGSPYCINAANPVPTFLNGGIAGIFTAPAGLSIDAANGLVDLSTSTAGTYTVTNTIAASGGCAEVIYTSDITITDLPVAEFEYSGSPYCSSDADPAPTFLNGGVAGVFTSTAGLIINPVTGLVDLLASTAGTYTVTNTISAAGGCPEVTFDASIEIQPAPIADFEYNGTPFCNNDTDPTPTFLNGGFAGVFSASAGLVINATTGEVDLSASTSGTYTVTNTIAASGSCPEVFYTSDITITDLPIADFEYTDSPYCSDIINPSPTFLNGGVAGAFSAPAGLVIDNASGEVDLTASAAGTYTVTNTISTSGGCPEVIFTADITITELPIPDFEYSGSPYCSNAADPAPTFLNGGFAGSFTAPAGLVINAITGEVDLSASTAGTYTVTNTIVAVGGCSEVSFDAIIEIEQAALADFEYSGSPYCSDDTDPAPTFLNGGIAGTFSAPAGVVINAVSGTVDLSASTPGTYTITNTIAATGSCSEVVFTTDLTITNLPIADFEYSGSPYCSNATNPLPTFLNGGAAGVFTAPAGLILDSATGEVDLLASTPGTYTVTNDLAASGSCPAVSATSSIIIEPSPVVDAGSDESICPFETSFDFSTQATPASASNFSSLLWTHNGAGTLVNETTLTPVYTPAAVDAGTTVEFILTADGINVCNPVRDTMNLDITPIQGDPAVYGNETWIGYVYDDSGDAQPLPARIDFDNGKYRGFIDETDIDGYNAQSTYDITTDVFDFNPDVTTLSGPNICGTYDEDFSIRYRMRKTLPTGLYTFSVGSDDGVRFLIDGVNIITDPNAFQTHAYNVYTSDPICLDGPHDFIIEYYERGSQSRLSFDYASINYEISVTNSTDPTTCNGTDGQIDLAFVNVPDGIYTIDYDGGSFTGVMVSSGAATINTGAGAYNNLSISIGGCTSIGDPSVILSDPVNFILSQTTTDVSNCGASDGSIDLTVSGGSGDYSFSWVGPNGYTSNMEDPGPVSGLEAGIYIVEVTDNVSTCMDILSIEITSPSNITLAITSSNDPTTCGATDGEIVFAFTNVPNGTYSIDYDGGTFTNVAVSGGAATVNAGAGTYDNLIISIGGCTSAEDVDAILNDPVTHTVTLAGQMDPTTCGAADGSISLNFTNVADGAYDLDYVDEDGTAQTFTNILISGNAATINGLTAGEYNNITLTIGGCTSTEDVDVTLNDPVTHTVALAGQTDPTTCGAADGSINLSFTNVADGTFDLDYVDEGGTAQTFTNILISGNAATINGLMSGEYNNITLTIGGCTSTENVDVTLNDPVTYTVALAGQTDPTTCGAADGSIALNFTNVADGTYDLDYVDGGGTAQTFSNILISGNAAVINGLMAGEYNNITLTIGGCTSAEDIDVTLNDPVTHTIAIDGQTDPTTCGAADGSIALSFTNVADGTYDLDYVDGGGTAQTFSNILISGNAAVINGLMAGEYNNITLSIGGCTSTEDVDITLADPVTFTVALAGQTDATSCSAADGSISLNFTNVSDGTYDLDYVDGDGTIQTFSNVSVSSGSATVNGLMAGQYNDISLTIGGCTSIDDLDVTLNAPVNYTIALTGQTDPTTCGAADGSISLGFTNVPDGTYDLDYIDGSGTAMALSNVLIAANAANINGLTSGEYNNIKLTIGGCTSTEDIDVTLNDPVTYTVTLTGQTDPTTCGAADGSISLNFTNVPDGTYDLDYIDGDGVNQTFSTIAITGNIATINNLSSGTYNDITLAIGGCTSTEDIDVTLTAPTSFSLSLSGGNISTCGGNDGFINISITPAAGDYSFNWSGPNGYTATTQNITDLDRVGTYSVQVTDNISSCTSNQSFSISQPIGCGGTDCFAFTKNIVSTTRPDCSDDNGAFVLEIIGSTSSGIEVVFEPSSGLGSYSMASPANTITISTPMDLSAGIYRYTIADGSGNNCPIGQSFIELKTLTSVEAKLKSGSEEDVTCFGGTGSAILDSLANSSTGQYWYSLNGSSSWNLLGGDRRVSGLPAGTTTLLVGERINDDCPAEVEVTLDNINPEIQFITTSQPVSDCGNNDGSITIDFPPSGGVGGPWEIAYKQTFDLPVLESDFEAFNATKVVENLESDPFGYQVFVRDAGGCIKASDIIEINAPNQVEFDDIATIDANCNDIGKNGTLSFSVTNRSNVPGPYVLIITLGEDESEIFYQDNDYDGSLVVMDTLSAGTYNVTIDPSDNQYCPKKETEFINGGPVPVSFDYQLLCQTGDLSKDLVLTDILGADNESYILKILDRVTNDIVFESAQFSPTLDNEKSFLNLTILNSNAEYILVLEQEQIVCPGKIISYRHPENLVVPAQLTAHVGETTSSLPDRLSGTMQIFNFSGGRPEYQVRIELDSSAIPGQNFMTDYDTVRINTNFDYEMIYEDIPAGRYLVEVMDELGCVIELEGRVPLNTDLFIPNVFTPNGDSKNDTFFIRNLPDFDVELAVTNRWGKEIYRTGNYQNNWTGNDTPDGIYFYKLDIAGELYTGWVEILRGNP